MSNPFPDKYILNIPVDINVKLIPLSVPLGCIKYCFCPQLPCEICIQVFYIQQQNPKQIFFDIYLPTNEYNCYLKKWMVNFNLCYWHRFCIISTLKINKYYTSPCNKCYHYLSNCPNIGKLWYSFYTKREENIKMEPCPQCVIPYQIDK